MVARRRRDNVIVAVLAVLAILGGGHAILDWFATDPPPPSDSATPATVGRAQLAGSFAEQFIVTYLGSVAGQQDRLGEYVGGSAQQITLPTTARQVSEPMVVYVARIGSFDALEVWSVTVSVRVGKTTGAAGTTGTVGTAAEARQYYRVGVSVLNGRLRALSLPALVEPPSRGADLAQAYSSPCTTDTPLAQVASGFLTAYLTGTGDVGRYITLDAGIAALRPAPFTAVETVAVTSDDNSCGTARSTAQVLATVNPKGDGGAAATLAYPLTMVRDGGQWQVQSVDSVPAMTNPPAVVAEQDSRGSRPSTSVTSSVPSSVAQIPRATQN
ncbi:conjugal transfer protein [Nocardia sp. NBC_00565]|uniref:conjugal transfer protein n=1 Tax=Nocardia sp. NBC_00565 TaxID=2975993 RepID=UPI002E80F166|nr:conjugal transfer protein [Nocardia sp. NBC_00565]WUC07710.1 conjugal transfer protein [Nocardia sp. NBC_00565]